MHKGRGLSLAVALGATLLVMGCRNAGDQTRLDAPKYGAWGMDLTGMDK